LTAICSATKRDGTRCTLPAQAQQDRCWAHDERNAAQRRRIAVKGGRGKASSATKELHALLEDLTARVVDGTLPTARGAVANQLIHTKIRLLDFERRLRELDDVEERLARLEREGGQGDSGWGA